MQEREFIADQHTNIIKFHLQEELRNEKHELRLQSCACTRYTVRSKATWQRQRDPFQTALLCFLPCNSYRVSPHGHLPGHLPRLTETCPSAARTRLWWGIIRTARASLSHDCARIHWLRSVPRGSRAWPNSLECRLFITVVIFLRLVITVLLLAKLHASLQTP